jgi:hypothetical protein
LNYVLSVLLHLTYVLYVLLHLTYVLCVLLHLAYVLSVFLRLTASDYSFWYLQTFLVLYFMFFDLDLTHVDSLMDRFTY